MSLLPDLSFDVHDVGYVAYMMVITVVLLLLLSYIFSSYKLFIKSKKQVAEFDGPWSHWLKGNIKDVSTYNQFPGPFRKTLVSEVGLPNKDYYYLSCTSLQIITKLSAVISVGSTVGIVRMWEMERPHASFNLHTKMAILFHTRVLI